MGEVKIKVENVSKKYKLGEISTGTISHDLNRWWHKLRGKEDPYAIIGEENDRSIASDASYAYALQGINFEVKEGEILGIVGKNGAGKSTLLKILSKVTGPSTGLIKMNGRIGALLEVGTGMHPELTGRENIFLNGAILGMTKIEIKRKIDEIIDFAGIVKYIDTPLKRYSSGMQVRLAFAVAAFLEPEILIVDEVLAVGDYEFQKKAIGKMKDVSSNDGRTVLFVSHNLAAVRNLCNKGILLQNGKKVFEGDQNEVIERYQNANLSESKIEFNSPQESNYANDKIQILTFKVVPSVKGELKISTGFSFKIDFNHIPQNKNLAITLEVRTLDEIVVFHHGHWICDNKNSISGIYELDVKIPPNTLNAGIYKVTLILATSIHEVLYKKEDIIQFEIRNESIANNNNILPGILRPKLDYTFTTVKN